MARQPVLPIKLERTEGRPTASSGLAFSAEFLHALGGIEVLVDQRLPKPGSDRGLAASQYVTPLSLILYGGGETISSPPVQGWEIRAAR